MAPNAPLAVSLQLEDAVQLVPTALLCLLYASRVRALASSGQPVPGWRQGCFYAGGLVFAAALIGVGKAGEELLFVHMIESLLIADVAALLIVLGLTGPLLAPILEIGLFDRLRVLANPLIAFPLWAIDLYLWHLPGPYQGAVEHVGLNLLQHVMFLGFRDQHVDVPVWAVADAWLVWQPRQAALHRRGEPHCRGAWQHLSLV